MLDESLTWTDHTNMIANKISMVTGVLHRLKNIFPKEILLTLYNTLILSYINYGLLVWDVKSSRIDVPQKKAIRLVTNSSYFTHTTSLFLATGLLKVSEIFKLKLWNFFINYLMIYCPLISVVILMSLIRTLLVYCVGIAYNISL